MKVALGSEGRVCSCTQLSMPVPQIFEGIVVLLAAVYRSAFLSASTGCLCASAAQFGYDGRRGEARSSVPSVAP